MAPIDHAALAADTFRQISETERGERARRASACALVLRAVERAADAFGRRRAAAEVEALPRCNEKAILHRVLGRLDALDGARDAGMAAPLVSLACELERTRRLPEADAALTLARSLAPDDAAVALHAGRVARKAGDLPRALALYVAARELDARDGAVARLARIGEAVVSAAPERALGRAIRLALRASDAEAAAVGLEERARVRRAAGDRRGAARDLCLAAVRYADPVDRARVAHDLAGLALASSDLAAAREALQAALSLGDGPQKDHARARLHTLSRDLGDDVGMRRWRSFQRPSLVSLSAYRGAGEGTTQAPRLLRWREALERRSEAAAGA
jgi:tetratricopeptide (TPR) repeat protein